MKVKSESEVSREAQISAYIVIIKEDDLIVSLAITNIVHRLTCNYSCESLLSCIRKKIKHSIFAYFGHGRSLLW